MSPRCREIKMLCKYSPHHFHSIARREPPWSHKSNTRIAWVHTYWALIAHPANLRNARRPFCDYANPQAVYPLGDSSVRLNTEGDPSLIGPDRSHYLPCGLPPL